MKAGMGWGILPCSGIASVGASILQGGRSILMIVSRSGRLLGISKHGGSLSLLSTAELRLTRCKATRWTAVTCDLRPAKGYASTSPNLFGSFLFGTSKLC